MRDLAIVGGGPAGMAAAVAASRAGLDVVLIDAQARLGGQYFRHAPEGFRARRPGALHHGFVRFTRLAAALRDADVRLGHRVWAVERARGDGEEAFAVHCLAGAREERRVTVRARRLLIATGAHDRPLPFPGWDLPGVLTAGGAQALLKGDLVVAGRTVVVAGTGPFLLPVAAGLAEAGARVAGVFEAGGGYGLAPALAADPSKIAEGAGYALRLARRRVPYAVRHAVVEAHGADRLTHVTVARLGRDWAPGERRTIACDALAVGYGFVPQIDLAVQLGCPTRAGRDGEPVVVVDAGMRAGVPGVYAAGEPTGVGGAELAEVEGWTAGRSAAADLGRPVRPAPALARRRSRLAAFGAAVLDAYPVRDGWKGWLRDDTLVCRCEEVPYARVREALELGAVDARSVKLLSRAGMGWCQGRICGHAVARLAGEEPSPPRRPLAQPVRLGDLAAGPASDTATQTATETDAETATETDAVVGPVRGPETDTASDLAGHSGGEDPR
ncbi:oxidase [Sphaerisporangium krabiense]|uniref:Thioredoxin reductase n=1 Tax=Sphaerisporangium krabiense TaxID=763782 RepID=A0A7W8ZBJ8_9ACTN|nr:FAD/NAD(P)-binding oxidoreductase [Sphaerisporangium krabiense]MBB5631002.1 thioredoxin reductase [Sphaerisporangium krabiense]GII65885.1 oxidase [Sphaerisporangium krabiense]